MAGPNITTVATPGPNSSASTQVQNVQAAPGTTFPTLTVDATGNIAGIGGATIPIGFDHDTYLYDNFATASNAASVVGRSPNVGLSGLTWNDTGAQGAQILGGFLQNNAASGASGVTYAYINFGQQITGAFADVAWSANGGTADPTQNTMTIALCPDTSGLSLVYALHLNFSPTGYTLTTKYNANFATIAYGSWAAQMLMDGATTYRISMLVRGSTVSILGPFGEIIAANDVRVNSSLLSPAKTAFWEPNATTNSRALVARVGATYTNFATQPSWTAGGDVVAGAGLESDTYGDLAGSRGAGGQMNVGAVGAGGYPAILAGPTNAAGLLPALGTGVGTVTLPQVILPGSTLYLSWGTANQEIVTVSSCTWTSSTTATVNFTPNTALTHASGDIWVANANNSNKPYIQYNQNQNQWESPNTLAFVDLRIGASGSAYSTALSQSATNYLKVLDKGPGNPTSLGVTGGFRAAEGSNAKQGVATLAGGTVVVSNTSVTANSRIFLTVNTPGGTVGSPYVSARTAGTSFTITSTSGTDTSTVAYEIFEPA